MVPHPKEPTMANITVKNIPDELYEQLRESAGVNHRSLNREIIACIERSVGCQRIDVDAFLAEARRIREEIGGPPITDAEFTEAKRFGRS
jgi:antitoxin FitA